MPPADPRSGRYENARSPATTVPEAFAIRVRAFLESCEIDRNLSRLTVLQYEHYLWHFLAFLQRQEAPVRDVSDLTPEVVRRYKLALARQVNAANRRLISGQRERSCCAGRSRSFRRAASSAKNLSSIAPIATYLRSAVS